jgi:hypothetical protein
VTHASDGIPIALIDVDPIAGGRSVHWTEILTGNRGEARPAHLARLARTDHEICT